MKTNKKLMLLFVALSIFAACQKQSSAPPQTTQNAATQESITAQSLQSFNAADFVTGINNPYFPLEPGTTKYYINKSNDSGVITVKRVTTEVTHDIKVILGVNCEVVHDFVMENGTITEDTYDWYAQDKNGSVWYFGEDTKKLTDTGWSTLGSWEAGVNGAVQGIIMYGHPGGRIGQTYYQEYYKGFAEDQATLISGNSTVNIKLGTFTHCVETREFTQLNTTDVTRKVYAPGLGEVLAESIPAGGEKEELVAIRRSR